MLADGVQRGLNAAVVGAADDDDANFTLGGHGHRSRHQRIRGERFALGQPFANLVGDRLRAG